MKKIVVLFVFLLLVCGCTKTKENEKGKIEFENYNLTIKSSDVCAFDELVSGRERKIQTYCIDSVKITDKDNNSYELKDALKNGYVTMENIMEGLVIKSEEKDGSIVLYNETSPEFFIVKCGEKYPNDITVLYLTDYNKVYCEL